MMDSERCLPVPPPPRVGSTTPSKSRIPSAKSSPMMPKTSASILDSANHGSPTTHQQSTSSNSAQPHPARASPEPANEELSTNDWLGVQQPEASPSPRCLSNRRQQALTGSARAHTRASGVPAVRVSNSSVTRAKASNTSSPRAQHQHSEGAAGSPGESAPKLATQARVQQRPQSVCRSRETKGSLLRKSAVEERLRGVQAKHSSSVFGSSTKPIINAAPSTATTVSRSVSAARERPASAEAPTAAGGQVGACVDPCLACTWSWVKLRAPQV